MFQPKTILHPSDFSVNSTHAFHIAVDLARQYGAKVLILHVVETLGPENVSFGEVASQVEPDDYRQRLLEDLQRIVPVGEGAISVSHILAAGNPAKEIVRVAQEQGCDLIVMGTHGRTGLRRLLMGSIAEQVARHAYCPVLTIRTQEPVKG